MKLIFITFCVCLVFGGDNVQGFDFSISSLVQSTGDTIKGVASKFPLAIPTPDTIFNVGKNVLAGYPVEAAFKAISIFCKFSFHTQTS